MNLINTHTCNLLQSKIGNIRVRYQCFNMHQCVKDTHFESEVVSIRNVLLQYALITADQV